MTIPKITVEELVAAAAQAAEAGEQIALIDVREADEWAGGHVAYASHVALGTVPDRLDVFGPDDAEHPTYVICRSGARSLHACEVAAMQGKHVVNVVGGMMAWVQAGHDVTVGN